MSAECDNLTATTLCSNFFQKETIAESYTGVHSLLAITTNGFEVLQLLNQKTHTLLALKMYSYDQHTEVLNMQESISVCEGYKTICHESQP